MSSPFPGLNWTSSPGQRALATVAACAGDGDHETVSTRAKTRRKFIWNSSRLLESSRVCEVAVVPLSRVVGWLGGARGRVVKERSTLCRKILADPRPSDIE